MQKTLTNQQRRILIKAAEGGCHRYCQIGDRHDCLDIGSDLSHLCPRCHALVLLGRRPLGQNGAARYWNWRLSIWQETPPGA